MGEDKVMLLEESTRILGEDTSGLTSVDLLIPLALQGLVPGTILGFPVYVYADGSRYLVHGRSETFDAGTRARLLAAGSPTVYVPQADLPAYQAYLEAHLPRILGDAAIPEPVKADLVYRSSQGLVREILERPEDPQVVVRAQKAAETMVDYLLRGRESVQNIIQSCSFDYKTYTHSVNVSIFCVVLGQKVGIGEDRLPELATAALLHDIGKAQVDGSILNKKGPLTPPEWEIMRRHPGWGVDLVGQRSGVNSRITGVIFHHHEKLDGSGYPHALRAEDLPLEVRISTICDIFDALTTNRSYKGALRSFDAFSVMNKDFKGKIDAALFQEFIKALKAQE